MILAGISWHGKTQSFFHRRKFNPHYFFSKMNFGHTGARKILKISLDKAILLYCIATKYSLLATRTTEWVRWEQMKKEINCNVCSIFMVQIVTIYRSNKRTCLEHHRNLWMVKEVGIGTIMKPSILLFPNIRRYWQRIRHDGQVLRPGWRNMHG